VLQLGLGLRFDGVLRPLDEQVRRTRLGVRDGEHNLRRQRLRGLRRARTTLLPHVRYAAVDLVCGGWMLQVRLGGERGVHRGGQCVRRSGRRQRGDGLPRGELCPLRQLVRALLPKQHLHRERQPVRRVKRHLHALRWPGAPGLPVERSSNVSPEEDSSGVRPSHELCGRRAVVPLSEVGGEGIELAARGDQASVEVRDGAV
jgi:hypothetical protein